jgi:hypothetical protein
MNTYNVTTDTLASRSSNFITVNSQLNMGTKNIYYSDGLGNTNTNTYNQVSLHDNSTNNTSSLTANKLTIPTVSLSTSSQLASFVSDLSGNGVLIINNTLGGSFGSFNYTFDNDLYDSTIIDLSFNNFLLNGQYNIALLNIGAANVTINYNGFSVNNIITNYNNPIVIVTGQGLLINVLPITIDTVNRYVISASKLYTN